jgi:hypothetical protein
MSVIILIPVREVITAIPFFIPPLGKGRLGGVFFYPPSLAALRIAKHPERKNLNN